MFFLGSGAAALPEDPVNTPYSNAFSLFTPGEEEGFVFAVLGDRTGGPESGLVILEQAVAELNRLDPDLVMTVGDLINGYNQKVEWMAQMKRFKRIAARFNMPWYPVAGNHDVYAPGADPKDRTNERLYQEHFGPLYYSFDHKNAHFIALYSDENLSYRNPPVDQQMSEKQLDWLQKDLAATRARHAFVFLHHPRWNYAGDIWEPVHRVLAESGKVRAVFAGHWHRYRSDGARDGIRYYCMATTGAHKENLEAAGALHHYNLVTVRKDTWSMTVIPVGAVLHPDFVSGQESQDVWAIKDGGFFQWKTSFPAPVEIPVAAAVEGLVTNSTTKEMTFNLRMIGLPETGWRVEPDSISIQVLPGTEQRVELRIKSPVLEEGETLPGIGMETEAVYPLEKGGAQTIRMVSPLPFDVPDIPIAMTRHTDQPRVNRALNLDGKDDCAVIEHAPELNADGPFTLECWARLDTPGDRAALLTKTESSAYGLFLTDRDKKGPSFLVYFEGKGYTGASGVEENLCVGFWTHFAGVFDGNRMRLYVNGTCLEERAQEGPLRGNELPLIVGADVNRHGRPVSFARGLVDEVRLSKGARYEKDFTPERRLKPDEYTVLLLHFDTVYGDRSPDCSGHGFHGRIEGGARLVPVGESR
jgi:hypothetical protein